MRTGRQTMRDLLDEAKKRIVLLFVCVVGLSYLMSLTSSSVWVNLPAAASLIIFLRYISFDLDVRRRSSSSNKPASVNETRREKKSAELPKVPIDKLSWRRKVDSPVVEAAIDQFTRHLVSEWVTDLWYARITPDKDGPEELVHIMNNVLGEVSCRAKEINLINLLTRDIIDLFCSHLELYRSTQAKIGKEELGKVSTDHRDAQIKLAMVAENKLHPALASAEAEHKVLQHLATGLISLTFKPEDLHCSFFRYAIRELLACAVIRPVLNLANPRFINEKVESVVTSLSKRTDGIIPVEDMPQRGPSRTHLDHSSGLLEGSSGGVELVQLKHKKNTNSNKAFLPKYSKGADPYLDRVVPLASGSSNVDEGNTGAHAPRSEWAHMLDVISTRKTRALAPEHFENMWTKGRDYRKKEDESQVAKTNEQNKDPQASGKLDHSKVASKYSANVGILKTRHQGQLSADALSVHGSGNLTSHLSDSFQGDAEVDSESSYQTDDDDGNNVTGLDSPVTRVWDSKDKRNSDVTHIRHPLENFEVSSTKRSSKSRAHHLRIIRSQSGRKKSRSSSQKIPTRLEVERASFLSGDNRYLSEPTKSNARAEHVVDESEVESWDRFHSGSAASSSMSTSMTSEIFAMEDSFLKLRCEVLGANIVKSGVGTFAVYSILFRHFEELHRRLKEFAEYNLHLPPKHFLSSGLEVTVIQERCKLLDKYLKMLLQLPTLSRSIEVWDFLSVDSQTYIFADSFSIIQTLSVDLDYKPYEKGERIQRTEEIVNANLCSNREKLKSTSESSGLPANENSESDTLVFKKTNTQAHLANNSRIAENPLPGKSESDSKKKLQETNPSIKNEKPVKVPVEGADGQQEPSYSALETDTDPTIPIEWIPPNLSMPILDLVDVVFQLQDGGWIRRQVFWIAKQVLQLGMGDAFDDWLIEKIQLLRRGSILWPDGIFITKHPNRRRPTPVPSPQDERSRRDKAAESLLTDEQRREAARRAEYVHELIVQKAPAALVGLIGRKEYEQCAEDVYYFLQSSVCLKQLAFELLELLLLAAFPELDDVIRQFHEDKDQTPVTKKNP
ncbi:unnamed protein product [Spirodela intermedia]|uniref:Uncharacterized protein n=1 Tax=Spirodela intermedia TaxID=51605 RepID=A0A7I8J944_SPIIN|nr:unnamed protein product [Spirodela intermedia]CAA6665972.1 unnamed protein product [Spirodela intermedia]